MESRKLKYKFTRQFFNTELSGGGMQKRNMSYH